jgi:hypothetical protein
MDRVQSRIERRQLKEFPWKEKMMEANINTRENHLATWLCSLESISGWLYLYYLLHSLLFMSCHFCQMVLFIWLGIEKPLGLLVKILGILTYSLFRICYTGLINSKRRLVIPTFLIMLLLLFKSQTMLTLKLMAQLVGMLVGFTLLSSQTSSNLSLSLHFSCTSINTPEKQVTVLLSLLSLAAQQRPLQ